LIGTDNIGLPYGTIVFRLEKREHFYRNERSVSLGKVLNVRKKVLIDKVYKVFEYGYEGKLDIGQVNAVDEFNTIRKSELPIVNCKNPLKASTHMRTSGYQIERQRRLLNSTEDSNLDDVMFAVSVIRSGETFVPKKDEGYEEINNVLEPATGYNYDLSPGRIRDNWKQVLAASLWKYKGGKLIKFSSGEINYRVSTKKVGEPIVYEDGIMDLKSTSPLWVPELYTIKDIKVTREMMSLIKSNLYGYIEFQDRFGVTMRGYISDTAGIVYNSTTRTASFELYKKYDEV
jgi:hypothetical protein